ncbi:hypothetical protein [Geodermatophilus obscurus]
MAAVRDVLLVVDLNQHDSGAAQHGFRVEGDTDDVGAPDYCG